MHKSSRKSAKKKKNLEQLFKIDARTAAYLKRRFNNPMHHPSENNVQYDFCNSKVKR